MHIAIGIPWPHASVARPAAVPWPDLPAPDLPDWPRPPDWVSWVLDKAKYVWPVVVAYVLARAEIRRRREQDAAARSRSLRTRVALTVGCDAGRVTERNVLGGELEPCGTDPMTGFFRDGCCNTGPEDRGSHTICAVVTAEFLAHQRSIGNDLTTPMPEYGFPGLVPGDRWCVTAVNWARAYRDGAAAPVVLASTNEAVLELVPLEALREHAVDVPDDLGELDLLRSRRGPAPSRRAWRRTPSRRGRASRRSSGC